MGQVLEPEVRVLHVQRAVKVPVAVRRVEGHGGDGPLVVPGEVLVDLVEGLLVQPGGGPGGHVQGDGILGAVLVNDDPQGALHLVVPVVAGPEGNLQIVPVLGAAGGPEDQVVNAIAVPPVRGIVEPLPGQLVLGVVGVPGDADLPGEGGVGVPRDELHVVQRPAGVGQVLVGLVKVAAVEGDGAAGGHPVDHLAILLAVLVHDDAEGPVVVGIAVVVADGYGQLVPHIRPGVRPEADGIQGVIPVPLVIGVKLIILQVVPVQGAAPGVERSVKILIIGAHQEVHPFQRGAVIAELFIGLFKPGDLEVHRAAGGHPVDDVGGVRNRAREGDGAGDLVVVLVHGGIGHAEAPGTAGHVVDVAGEFIVVIAVPEGVLLAVVVEPPAAAGGGGKGDAGEAALPREGPEEAGHLAADVRSRQLPGGGAHGDGDVLPRGVQAVQGGVGRGAADGGPGGHRGLVPVAGGGGAALQPAHEDVAAGDAGQPGAVRKARGGAALAHPLRGGAAARPEGDGAVVRLRHHQLAADGADAVGVGGVLPGGGNRLRPLGVALAAFQFLIARRNAGGRGAAGNRLHIVVARGGNILGEGLLARLAQVNPGALFYAGGFLVYLAAVPGVLPIGGGAVPSLCGARRRQGGGDEARQHHQRQSERRELFLPKSLHKVTSVPAENWII